MGGSCPKYPPPPDFPRFSPFFPRFSPVFPCFSPFSPVFPRFPLLLGTKRRLGTGTLDPCNNQTECHIGGVFGVLAQPPPPAPTSEPFSSGGKVTFVKAAGHRRPIEGTQILFWPLNPPPPPRALCHSPPPPPPRDELEGGEVPPLQGAQPMPSHCLPHAKCQLQRHL